ncbi:MAG: phosphotransferase [Gammaproteobacteria bacterium]|nr:phosphotransferase [Gammaproteobacteria bacterium]
MLENQIENIVDRDHSDARLEALKQWVKEQLAVSTIIIKPASVDASFRRYFRVWMGDNTYIAMDAPPDKENCSHFVDIAYRLRLNDIHAPEIHAKDLRQGFLLLDDLGDKPYLSCLDSKSVATLYGDALDTLLCMQNNVPADDLPPYDSQQLQNEMDLFVHWFLQEHLHIKLDEEAKNILTDCFELLIASALEQPRVFVHRDYHSRNLMVCDAQNPGVLDFQDAMYGPITYDLASLLRDCYIAWPRIQIQHWLKLYYTQLSMQQLINVEFVKFERWFDWMGMQRHLKAIGIFARLHHRDGKSNFLVDIPRTYDYIVSVCKYYPDFMSFSQLMARLRIHERLAT